VQFQYWDCSVLFFLVNGTGTLIGARGLDFYDDSDEENNNKKSNADKFFAVKPGISLYINLAKFCRMGVRISYRKINGLDIEPFLTMTLLVLMLPFLLVMDGFNCYLPVKLTFSQNK
jgi:hypothetical protein